MKPKTLILMLVAVVCGLAAAYMAINLRGEGGEGGDKVMVVVAAGPLSNGTKIVDINTQLKVKPFTKDQLPANYVSNPQDLNGKVLGRPIDEGGFVTLKDLSALDNLFPPVGPDSKDNIRAFTVRVNVESSLSGFLLPGARVDLLVSYNNPNVKDTRVKFMGTFLQDVQVLAVGTQKVVPVDGQSVIPNAATITVALTPEQVQRVAWVVESRQVVVSLRRPGYKTQDQLSPVVGPYEGDTADGGTKADTEKPIQLPVAKKDIFPGTVNVNSANFKEYFEMLTVPPSLVRSNAIRDPSRILGPINHFVAAGQPVTVTHLKELKPGEKFEVTSTTLTITVGGQPSRIVNYENGRAVGTDGGGNPPTPRESPPQPEGAGPPKPGNGAKATDGPSERDRN